MNELRTRLQQGDPIRHEPVLDRDDRDRMRRTVLAASANTRISRSHGLIAVATLATLVLAIGTLVVRTVHQTSVSDAAPPQVATAQPDPESQHPRQLHFVTRGGTRVIWIFNSDFEVR